jgi:hypothetical protein
LFWEDLDYGAKFVHASRLLLLDDRTGAVVRKSDMRWWPMIGTRAPPFIRQRGPADSRFRIYTRFRRPFPFYGSNPPPAAVTSTTGATAHVRQLAPSAYSGDCLVTLVDPAFSADRQRMSAAFSQRGIRVFDVPRTARGAPGGAELQAFVKQLSRICPDIIIYISGHGSEGIVTVGQVATEDIPPPGSKRFFPHATNIRFRDADVSAGDLVTILKANPQNSFKFIIDTCFAAEFTLRFTATNALMMPGMKLLVTSSGMGPSYQSPGGSTFTNGLVDALPMADTQVAAEAFTGFPPGVTPGARLIERAAAQTVHTDWGQYLGLSHPKQISNLLPPGTSSPPPPTPNPPSPPAGSCPPSPRVSRQAVVYSTDTSYVLLTVCDYRTVTEIDIATGNHTITATSPPSSGGACSPDASSLGHQILCTGMTSPPGTANRIRFQDHPRQGDPLQLTLKFSDGTTEQTTITVSGTGS